MEEPHLLRSPPQRLGKYQVTGVLGEGAMGVVYRGFDPDIRRVVALKTIRHRGGAEDQASAETLARFRREAQAAGCLLHPGIVAIYDFGDGGDCGDERQVAFIAMEVVEGPTLAKLLARQVRFTDADIASLATQLLQALAHAHENGVWHRDIKPSNVIITPTGRAKIADFGIARTAASDLTQAHSVLGTPMYMAPEQFMGQAIDHRVDLYAVGVLLYQVVAGRAPFVGPLESLMQQVVGDLPAPPSLALGAAGRSEGESEGGRRSARFDGIVARAMAKDPQARYASATEFIHALRRVLDGPVPAEVSHATLHALPASRGVAPTERFPSPDSSGRSVPPVSQAWLDATAKLLTDQVGPIARVLVKRAAERTRQRETLQRVLADALPATRRRAFLDALARLS